METGGEEVRRYTWALPAPFHECLNCGLWPLRDDFHAFIREVIRDAGQAQPLTLGLGGVCITKGRQGLHKAGVGSAGGLSSSFTSVVHALNAAGHKDVRPREPRRGFAHAATSDAKRDRADQGEDDLALPNSTCRREPIQQKNKKNRARLHSKCSKCLAPLGFGCG